MRKLRIFGILFLSRQVYRKKQRTLIDTAEFRVLKGFVNNGHEVHALMPREEGVPEDFSYYGICIHEFKMPCIPQPKTLMLKLLLALRLYFYYFLFIFLSTKRFVNVMKTYGRPDVIYGYKTGWFTAYTVGRLYKVPNITRLFGTLLYTSLSSPRDLFARGQCLELFAFKLPCKYLIITNDGTRGDEVARRLKVPHERVIYWMDGADFLYSVNIDAKKLRERMGIPQKAHVIVSVCRLTRWKRVDRLIQAVPAIAQVHNNIRVLIVGEGEERGNLERLRDELGVTKFVEFLGAVTHKDVERYLRIADIFVCLYDFSNLSNSTLEAMSCGVCTVALNSGATRQIIKNKENGILISYNDLGKLPAIIIRLLDDEDLRKRLGNKAKQYALENFKSWEERVAMEVDLIENAFQ